MPLILGSNAPTGGYEIDNSLRFDDGSSDYLKRTPAGAGDSNRIFTLSFWFKRSTLTGAEQYFFEVNEVADNDDNFRVIIGSGENLFIQDTEANVSNLDLRTNRLFRDVSAWYHLVLKVDTTQATSSDRAKLYINGVQETSFSTETYPSQNYDTNVSQSGEPFIIGRRESIAAPTSYFDGYLSEYFFIDGTALDATSFGEFDEDSGIWKPINVSGLTFGTNGFYLDFEDSSALGDDVSGNGNDFTVNNLTSIDQTTDTPTNNFATLNSTIPHATPILYKDGNTIAYDTSGNFNTAFSTLGVNSGKWYFEAKTSTNNGFVGICKSDGIFPAYTAGIYLGNANLGTNSWGYYADDGSYFHNGSSTAYGNSWTNTDLIGCALDLDNNKLYFSKNGIWQNSGDPTSGTGAISITSGTYLFGVTKDNESSEMQCNFGNPPFTISSGNSDADGYGNFEYAVPSGYYALNTKNLAEYG